MGRALRSRLFGSAERSEADDPHVLATRIEELTRANRREPSRERERELVRLRHRAGAKLVAAARPTPADRYRPFGPLDEEGLASADPASLDGPLVRGGIEAHGYVLVRGLIERERALGLAAGIEAAFAARDDSFATRDDSARAGSDGLYEEFKPDPPYPPFEGRIWITAGGGILAPDSPRVMFEMLEAFEQAGLRRVIGEYLDEPITVSLEKSTLRRAEPAPPGGWHQDGSFMGRTRALNVWVALSDCGEDAPGLDFVPKRIEELVETGGSGSGAEHLERPDDDAVSAKTVLVGWAAVEAVAGDADVVRPHFEPGDVMLFDDRFVHRTGSDPEMPHPRYAIECWFFGASGFPRDYVPLAF